MINLRTWMPGSARYKKEGHRKSGEEQLNRLEAELKQHKPSCVFIHYLLLIVAAAEKKDYGVQPL